MVLELSGEQTELGVWGRPGDRSKDVAQVVENADANRLAAPLGFAREYHAVLSDRDDLKLTLSVTFGLTRCRRRDWAPPGADALDS